MDLVNIVDQAGAIVALAAVLGLLLLVPLYLSQRRDLSRLIAWMEAQPDHPASDVAASELILDRAEAELERLLPADEAPAPAPAPVPPPATAAARRVTSERPALERITMEREALVPHPRWRRFVGTVMRPRWLIVIAAAALLLGVAAIFGSELLLEPGDRERTPRAGAVDPSTVTVSVLNGTSVPGLGAKVGDDVEANGFDLGSVTTISDPYDQTVVMFEKGQERAARRVARDLGVAPVQPIDQQAQRLAEGADVVVIAGQDRASA